MGPISPTVLENSNYIAKFTNVYSRFSVVYFLKNKTSSSFLDSFVKFERDLAIPFDRRVPISPTVLENSNYIAKFTNVYSRFSVVYFLKNKTSSSFLDSFVKFERDLAIPFDRRVQYLRSDQGTEYTNRKSYFKRVLQTNWSASAIYCPVYTPTEWNF